MKIILLAFLLFLKMQTIILFQESIFSLLTNRKSFYKWGPKLLKPIPWAFFFGQV